ncbi:hypothetical protein [Chitinophaga filiformis]|uniref:hypothetical protein n=1 Tax=Chitinophaga filiformis TaxID=104663 RepID=UPI000B7EB56E|nr:hypothetical protein [Chitinophaga filiformis]
MNKFNPFQRESPLFSFRWFILFASLIAGLLFRSDTTGWRLFSGSGQQQWSASGAHGYHK